MSVAPDRQPSMVAVRVLADDQVIPTLNAAIGGEVVAAQDLPLSSGASGAAEPSLAASGHAFHYQPERREGRYFPGRDGAGTVGQWNRNRTWIVDGDITRKVFLCFDGWYFIDELDITWATD